MDTCVGTGCVTYAQPHKRTLPHTGIHRRPGDKDTLPHPGLLPPSSFQALPSLSPPSVQVATLGPILEPFSGFHSSQMNSTDKRGLPPLSPGTCPLSSQSAVSPTPQPSPASAVILALWPATPTQLRGQRRLVPPVLTSQNTACVQTTLLE